MKVYRNLLEIIPYTPYNLEGKFNGNFSYVLLGGSSYKSKYFNKFEGNDYYKKYDYEVEFPDINFQKRLSETTTTFSFDRPTDLLNHNLYSYEKYENIYIATKKNLTIKNTAIFIYEILKYHNIKPPYIFIAFSEGGFDCLCFSKYYSKLMKQIYFIDTPLIGKYYLDFEKYRGNYNWYKKLFNNDLSWNGKEMSENFLEQIDIYNFEIKTLNIILRLKITDFSKKIPIFILWSPYFDDPEKKDKTKIKIQNKFNEKLQSQYDNIHILYVDAPHQMERTRPLSLSKFIIAGSNLFS